ncbi:hypothetical protein Gotur_011197, partial [Gossypium turneri]
MEKLSKENLSLSNEENDELNCSTKKVKQDNQIKTKYHKVISYKVTLEGMDFGNYEEMVLENEEENQ